MKHFLSALALGCLLLSCNRDLENNETPAPQNEKLVLLKSASPGDIRINYKNRNEIESLLIDRGSLGKSDIDYEYDAYGRIVKERWYWHYYDDGETNITYQYDSQGRLVSSHAISTEYEEYPGSGLPPKTNPLCSVERKHTYAYQGNKVTVKIERGADNCSSTPEAAKEKTITLFVENGRVVKSLDENNQIIETIEYNNTKNALRNIKGFPTLVAEFYIRAFTYELPYYNFIESVNDFRFIDNIKTRDFHDGSYWEYYYSEETNTNNYGNYDYIENVGIHEKSHNNPTHDEGLWWLRAHRYCIKEK